MAKWNRCRSNFSKYTRLIFLQNPYCLGQIMVRKVVQMAAVGVTEARLTCFANNPCFIDLYGEIPDADKTLLPKPKSLLTPF